MKIEDNIFLKRLLSSKKTELQIVIKNEEILAEKSKALKEVLRKDIDNLEKQLGE